MDAGKRTINDIFTGSKMLEIPFFQRSYVWKESEWERMLEDIENVCVTKEPYFMGSVILKQQLTQSNSTVGDVRTVIDGQQRLTTLSILLKVLCLKTNALRKFDKRFRLDDDRPVLQHSFMMSHHITVLWICRKLRNFLTKIRLQVPIHILLRIWILSKWILM